MSAIRGEPCSACPYRCDVPSGVWATEEYDKLPPYDAETFNQPTAAFACHATPDHLCHGWAVVHGWDLLGLRLYAANHPDVDCTLPRQVVPLFASGREAAEHGKRDIDGPSSGALRTQTRLIRKHPRLRRDT